ncbi:glucose-1-phosphate adenylyltransferase [Domibacillus enclensis]|uniref:Glucose-1-phosphate adenylyltransferase n=1 Tax=Domibacillus enclensis TaxID=1017273 RepID=A0A1N7C7Q8_9BACI|nr:glucose-1-phosphate adenylyltransferase [Domibacillus enclensis]OXS73922.1 glucose-1-phosphate adenylyltransferase [Domibacillus enclensis]SIR59622.1 glucose-1-phosphate adenylyltransferase [Domibacillus enclensis]
MAKQKCVAMLLAGGKGSRLKELTESLAKPAVPFGGKYRIIDFPLSNCANSGIHTVGVLTQYQPLVLNSYIGIGSAWDLDRKNGGVTVLPPYSESSEVKWYSGTASAIYQNLNYIKQYDPEYVLILSGDHIYKMNYDTMLDYHIDKQADVTISVIEVPWDEASRFGIMNTDEEYNVTRFDEKPEKPESNLASMGIYIFKWSVLRKYLEMDESNPDSSNDFGKDVIPAMLADELKLIAYPFKGYWKDVGTVKSLWEANMDLLDNDQDLNLFEHSWRIYSVNPNQPPQIIGTEAKIKHSLVNEGCVIDGEIEQSVMFQGVEVEAAAVVKECVVMPNARIGKGSYIERAIVMNELEVPENTIIHNHSDDILLITEEYLAEHERRQSRVEEA